MNSLRHDQCHVAQQIRRDKLRIHNTCQQHFQEFPYYNNNNNLQQLSLLHPDQFDMDLLQLRNNVNRNINANMHLDESSIESETPHNFSTSNSNPALEFQQLGVFPYSLVDNNIHSPQKQQCDDLGNWRHSTVTVPHQVTADNWIVNYATNNVDSYYHLVPNHNEQFSNEYSEVAGRNVMHHTPSSSSLMQQPSQGFEWRNNQRDSNPQSLSLSLSSNSQSKALHVSQFDQEGDLQCVNYMKPSIISRDSGKSIQEVVGLGIPNSKTTTTTSYRHVGPLGPFTGYATILKSSRFLKIAQQLLDEFCCKSVPKLVPTCDVSEKVSNVSTSKGSNAGCSSSTLSSSSMFHVSNQQKKAKLLFMQEEVSRRYKQYHQQMQMVFSSFESVAGLSSATPYISLTLKSVSKHFRCLNNSISEKLNLLSQVSGDELSIPTTSTSGKDDTNIASLRCMDQSLQENKPSKDLESQQHVWRPQRGFPERSVAILKAWLFEHFLHPYPTDTDKHMLATQTGLSRNQVSNWFINARVRVWKPMVEEIHTLEKKPTDANENYSRNEGTYRAEACSSQQPRVDKAVSKFGMHSIPENQYQDMELCEESKIQAEEWTQDKRSKLECQMTSSMAGNGTLMSFFPYQGAGPEVAGLGSVSLTLGLRHGVEGVQKQHQQLQEEELRHHLGGQMIHDFVSM